MAGLLPAACCAVVSVVLFWCGAQTTASIRVRGRRPVWGEGGSCVTYLLHGKWGAGFDAVWYIPSTSPSMGGDEARARARAAGERLCAWMGKRSNSSFDGDTCSLPLFPTALPCSCVGTHCVGRESVCPSILVCVCVPSCPIVALVGGSEPSPVRRTSMPLRCCSPPPAGCPFPFR